MTASWNRTSRMYSWVGGNVFTDRDNQEAIAAEVPPKTAPEPGGHPNKRRAFA